MTETILYGSPLSLFTGRARSYLIKAGIAYRETTPTSEHFKNQILPKMGGRQSIPVVETETGEVIRDGAAIIDFYETFSNKRFSPSSPKQKILSLLFDAIGCEGLLRPAMHYRWNFPDKNLDFLQFHFETFIPKELDRASLASKRMDQMRGAGRAFGVLPESFQLVENLYEELLVKLDQHFSETPYLLGNKPSIGDFGMIAPLYGHLGRDPAPLELMQTKAIRVFRWVERMNRPDADIGEFDDQREEYLRDDHIPDSLIDVLKHLAIDFVPETKAACSTINRWLSEQPDLQSGTVAERGVGTAEFEVRGTQLNALAQPYRFYLLERMQAAYDSLEDQEKQSINELFKACSMSDILSCKLNRKQGRLNNREVWL
ncbi:MAG: glutathione S-transferase family protein [Pseudohongiellaceae bacterium]